MKLAELGKELQISIESFIKLMRDFDLELAECLSTNLDIKKDFEKFILWIYYGFYDYNSK